MLLLILMLLAYILMPLPKCAAQLVADETLAEFWERQGW